MTHPSGPPILAPAAPATEAPAGAGPVPVGPAPADAAVVEELDATAAAFVASLVALDAHGPAFAGKVGAIARMGDRELREAAVVCNRVLDELDRPDPAVGQQAVALWATVSRLQQYALLAARLDLALEERIRALEGADPGRARALRRDVRPHARRRRRDLLDALAAAVRLNTAFASLHAAVEPLERLRATVAALERASGAPTGAGELALPASIPPAGVLPASVSGGD